MPKLALRYLPIKAPQFEMTETEKFKDPPSIILGFDFGMKQIGIAVGQSLTATATPEATLAAKDGIPDWKDIKLLIDQWQPAALVIGLPLNMDGSSSESSRRAKKFANRLHDKFRLPTHTADERLSTVEARNLAKTMSKTKGWQKHSLDSIAAAVILESWFAQQ